MRAWLALALALALLACGEEPKGSTTDAGGVDVGAADSGKVDAGTADAAADDAGASGPKDFDGLCAAIAEASCAPLAGCCKGEASRFSGVADCEAQLSAACLGAGAKEIALLKADGGTFHPERATACVAFYTAAAAQCDVAGGVALTDACRRVVTDDAKPGESCGSGSDGLRCGDGSALCFPTPTGVPCKAPAKVGQPCAEAPCQGLSDGAMLGCLPGDKGLVCGTPRGAGGACTATVHCDADHWCKAGVCVARSGEGVACSKAWHCGKTTGGAALACDPLTETCVPVLAKGAACYLDSQCGAGLRCVGTGVGKVCMFGDPGQGSDDAGAPTLGQPCTGTCAKGLQCTDGPLPGACGAAACAALGPK